MEKGKTGKYFKYAIGEILLVVIGILIALSINTWNENRKESVFEKEILLQIKTNLEQDRAALVAFATNGNRAIASANKILALPQGSEHDSLKYWLGDFMQFDRFQPLTSSYEVLKSKGLDLISNKELRFQLGSYYDDRSAFINKAITDLEWAFINEWLPITRKYVVDFKFKSYMELSDYDPFTSPSEARNSLIMNRDNWAGSVQYIEGGLELIDSIISMINTELGQDQ
ncbi:MAG: hypothetical protein KJO04_11090 [Bacteroidia bacterium]|nr:hypothetical protein [Bacteroidia bacterium]